MKEDGAVVGTPLTLCSTSMYHEEKETEKVQLPPIQPTKTDDIARDTVGNNI